MSSSDDDDVLPIRRVSDVSVALHPLAVAVEVALPRTASQLVNLPLGARSTWSDAEKKLVMARIREAKGKSTRRGFLFKLKCVAHNMIANKYIKKQNDPSMRPQTVEEYKNISKILGQKCHKS